MPGSFPACELPAYLVRQSGREGGTPRETATARVRSLPGPLIVGTHDYGRHAQHLDATHLLTNATSLEAVRGKILTEL